jgi:CHAT domain-containing protein/tetratricopeptide (TPR) repeat protein
MTTAAVVFLAVASLAEAGSHSAPPEALVPEQRVERVVAPGETLAFSLELEEGHVLPIVVRQQGIDVSVRVLAPGAAPSPEVDVAAGVVRGDEPASLGPGGGTYVLEVRGRENQSGPGRVTIEAGEALPAGARALSRLRAEHALAESAATLREARSPEAVQAALDGLQLNAAAWRVLGEDYWAAVADLLSGSILAGQDPARAMERGLDSVRVFRGLGKRSELCRALQTVAVAHYNRGEYAASLEPDLEALRLYREDGDARGEAQVLDSLGGTYLDMGETRRSLDYREEALGIARAAGDHEREAEVMADLGASYWFTGETDRAYDLFVLAGKALREQGNMVGAAATYHNMAFCQLILGDVAKAEAGMRQALPFCRAVEHKPCEAFVLQGIGLALDSLGRSSEALDFYGQSLAIRRSLEDKDGQAWLLVSAALTRYRRGETGQAMELANEALGIYHEIGGGWKLGLLLDLLGQIEAAAGSREAARARHREALDVRRAVGDRQGQSVSLLRLARLDRADGNLGAALKGTEEAIRLMEDMRGRMLSPDRRMAFMVGAVLWPSLRDAYEDEVGIRMALEAADPTAGHLARAFEASERARARVLVEMLSDASGDPGATGDRRVLDELRDVEDRLGAKLDQQVRSSREKPGQGTPQELAEEIERLTGELEQVRARLRSTSPRDAAVRMPEPLGMRELQERLLDPDTLLLEYFLGEERSWLWAVTPTSWGSYELPGRSQLEAGARGAHDATSSRPRPGGAPEPALREAARLLLQPVASFLAGKRVVIVPDGALDTLPFAALPDPGEPSLPMIAGHEVVVLPSASALRLLRADALGRSTPARTLVVLADPVFDRQDERLGARGAAAGARAEDPQLTRALDDAGRGGLARLPFTRREARRILALAPGGSGRAALDFDASLKTATDPDLANYRYVHFATHGFLNGARPELSGLVLSLVDRQGKDVRGFLSARDVLGLRLGADLVVLSGCSTALGREMRGEGTVGLTRAFLYAGAQRVVASLWEVDDAATEELMGRLYEGMLGPRRLRPAAALREAQLGLSRQGRWRSPFYWAAFQIHGEWN